jgi:hypothetical protein
MLNLLAFGKVQIYLPFLSFNCKFVPKLENKLIIY